MKAAAYAGGGWEKDGDVIPSVVGLAIAIGITKSTCYEWAKDENKTAFSDILTRVEQIQERKLLQGGLAGGFNPAVTKMILTKHGYSDKLEQAHTSPDGSMTPQAPAAVDPAAVAALVDKLTG